MPTGPTETPTGLTGSQGTTPRLVPEAEVFDFWAVQQGGGGRQLPWSSGRLRLVFDVRGIELIGERRGERSFMPWASVSRVSRGASRAVPGGGSVTLIGIDSPGRIMRFQVTSSHRDPIELSALSERVARWSSSGGRVPDVPSPPDLSPPPPPTEAPWAWPEQHPSQGSDLHEADPGSRDEADPRSPDGADPGSSGAAPAAGPPISDMTQGDSRQEAVALGVPLDPTFPGWEQAGGPPAPLTPPTTVTAVAVPSAPARPPPGAPPWPYSVYEPPPRRKRRTRRIAMLVVALVFLGSGIGLAVALSGSSTPPTTASPATSPPTPDQALAGQLMLTQRDLPAGWSTGADSPGSGSSPRIQTGEAKITRAFASCMGISSAQASLALGGGAADQTAQTSSPVFLGPPAPDQPGFAFELQTSASVVHSHQDEQRDFTLLADPRYPQCAGAAVASETQLGANSSSGRSERPGTPTVSLLDVPAPPGEQVLALLVAFDVSDRSASVPVEVEMVSLGHDRIEAEFQALAIGGQIPSGVLASPLSVFANRVAGGGQSAEA